MILLLLYLAIFGIFSVYSQNDRCGEDLCVYTICTYGRIIDENGCKTCYCNHSPCQDFECKVNEKCFVDEKQLKPMCVLIKEQIKCEILNCSHCPYGYSSDSNGCPTCLCYDPCEKYICPDQTECRVTNIVCPPQGCIDPPMPYCRKLENNLPTTATVKSASIDTTTAAAFATPVPSTVALPGLMATTLQHMPNIMVFTTTPTTTTDKHMAPTTNFAATYTLPYLMETTTTTTFTTTRDATLPIFTRTSTAPTTRDTPVICVFDFPMKICQDPVEPGPCKGMIPRYAYNPAENRCQLFYYSGCGGNSNQFLTAELCMSTCNSSATAVTTMENVQGDPCPPDLLCEAGEVCLNQKDNIGTNYSDCVSVQVYLDKIATQTTIGGVRTSTEAYSTKPPHSCELNEDDSCRPGYVCKNRNPPQCYGGVLCDLNPEPVCVPDCPLTICPYGFKVGTCECSDPCKLIEPCGRSQICRRVPAGVPLGTQFKAECQEYDTAWNFRITYRLTKIEDINELKEDAQGYFQKMLNELSLELKKMPFRSLVNSVDILSIDIASSRKRSVSRIVKGELNLVASTFSDREQMLLQKNNLDFLLKTYPNILDYSIDRVEHQPLPSPALNSEPDKKFPTLILIIVLAVAIPVFVLGLAIGICCCCKICKKKSEFSHRNLRASTISNEYVSDLKYDNTMKIKNDADFLEKYTQA